MAKTIQVRVDDQIKNSADMLFSSLGLDTSTAIRMFLVASLDAGGIPFTVAHRPKRSDDNQDERIREAIEYRKAGGRFLTRDEFAANMRGAIERGASYAE